MRISTHVSFNRSRHTSGPRSFVIIATMIRKYLPKSTEELIHWYERYISPIALVAGFLLDSFILLDRVDVWFGNLLLLSYLVLAGIGILVLNIVESGRAKSSFVLGISPFMPVVIQFFFGALFSGYLSLYSRSAGVALSWIFVLVLAFLLIGNERFRTRYQKLPFQLGIYFVALYSFFIFFLPLVVKKIGPVVFLFSGAMTILITALLLTALRALAPERVAESRRAITINLVGLCVLFNVLYFSNLIPPLPLALKDAGVYHAVERAGGNYHLMEERYSWAVRYLGVPATFLHKEGEKVYVFTAIFAPSGLDTVVRHEWQRFDESIDRWVTESDIKFPIHGGREGGFRGYSEKKEVPAGEWRVNVLTEHGQIIGRIRFKVEKVTEIPMLLERIL
jgi:hypothetical protein